MQKNDKGYRAICCGCGFDVVHYCTDKGDALRAFGHNGWKIVDPDGFKESSGDPSGDLCGMCANKSRNKK
jgi:hypothetical protein